MTAAFWLLILAADPAPVDYARDVKPLLIARCSACHGGLRQKSDLRLDTAELIRRGGEGGAAIVPGRSAESPLIEAIRSAGERPRMPPEGEGEPLTADEVSRIARWIDAGAPAPEHEEPQADPKQHWAYQPPRRVAPPLASGDWSSNPIDGFISAGHAAHGLTAVPLADRATLLRRVTLDLTGVPPTRETLHAFLADPSDEAYAAVVDKLLSSPRYAERWARHWMDIWRYSDWYGRRNANELRSSRRNLWRWRDWIVEALDKDKPYNRMVQEMLAADELAPGDEDAQRALGFLGRNYYVFSRETWLQDTVEHSGMSLLGVTFKCARCHDHKYDPISQSEYYQYRAFFEPYGVRTDWTPGESTLVEAALQPQAVPGTKIQNGLDRVYDATLDAPTYLLTRGDEKQPVKDSPLSPGVPAVWGLDIPAPQPVSLPLEAWYPELRPARRAELIANALSAIGTARKAEQDARSALAAAQKRLEDAGQSTPVRPTPWLADAFDAARPDDWQIQSGDWSYVDGVLAQRTSGSFLTMISTADHPRDFAARLRYKTLDPGQYHSVGFSFDVTPDARDWQAVYTATTASSSTVQAFHRRNGREEYPGPGIAPHPFKVGDVLTVDLVVRGEWINVWVNGELKLAYKTPAPRQPGRVALWCHTSAAEFDDLRIEPLSPDQPVSQDVKQPIRSPFAELEPAEIALQVRQAERTVTAASQAVTVEQKSLTDLEARIAAETAKYSSAPDAESLAKAASQAERELALAKAEQGVSVAEHAIVTAQDQLTLASEDSGRQKAVTDAQAKLAPAVEIRDKAQAALATETTKYEPLGPTYPTTSTGRRLALAQWVTDRRNPLTARVAVNHVWLRHMGTPLSPTVFNLGLNGKRPTHPELLDWLSVEFMEHGWSFKALHRLIVTSRTYQLASTAETPDHPNVAADPENRWYWRANPRRMEGEVVRDSLLSLAGELSAERGGPDIPVEQADASPRRSLYFRHTPDDRAAMLDLFDAPNPAECYRREESIVPQQALVLLNSGPSLVLARRIARLIDRPELDDPGFVTAAFEHVLCRTPWDDEATRCRQFLAAQTKRLSDPASLTARTTGTAAVLAPSTEPRARARENLVHALLNYNEFVTIR